MNQILDYNPNKSSGGGKSSGSDNIVRVFAVILILFALGLAAMGGYGIYKNKTQAPVAKVDEDTDAVISFEKGRDTGVLKVSHDKIIETVIYKWDSDEKEVEVDNVRESTYEVEIPLNQGTSTLTVKVKDSAGHTTIYTEVVESEEGKDSLNPVINISVTNEKKIKVEVTDDRELDFVTYCWGDEEIKRVDAEEGEKEITFEVEIPKGENDFLVTATDKAGNTTNDTKSFNGLMNPEVKITVAADKKSIDVFCFHENGVKTIELKINETEYPIDLGGETPSEVSFHVDLNDEKNDIYVKVTSVDDTKTEVNETVEQEKEEDEVEITIERIEGTDNVKISAVTNSEIKEVGLNVNDVDYDVNLQGATPSDLSFEIPLVDGNNRIKVVITTINDTVKEEIQEITK